MTTTFLLLAAFVAELPQVELSTLKGEQHAGQLASISETGIALVTAEGDVTVPRADVLELRLTGTAPADAAEEALLDVRLTDGSTLRCRQVLIEEKEAVLEHPQLGTFRVPRSVLAVVRLAAPEAKVDAAWDELLGREFRQDVLIVRKENVLDHLGGVAGTMDEQTVRFLLDGEEVPVKREKLFGIIFYHRQKPSLARTGRMELAGSDALELKQVGFDGAEFKVSLAAGGEVAVPAAAVRALDLSQGKVRYLSQMEPRDVKYVTFFENDIVWEYARDKNLDGEPISLHGQVFPRGLCIHSGTTLRYRLGGEYRRFQAVMGIDDAVRERGGNVHVVISGDGKTLFEGDVVGVKKEGDPTGAGEPIPLDLDVSGVRELLIDVGFGRDLDVCDHLDLAGAKVTK